MYQELNNLIGYLKGTKILIAGFGREGKSTLRFLLKHVPDVSVSVGDENVFDFNDEFAGLDIPIMSGETFFGNPDDFDLMIKTPGISLKKLPESWLKSDKITSQTDLLLKFFANKVIGITGTKGKSTTTNLVHHLLVSNGVKAILAGNMGIPFFDELENADHKMIVAELSCHQLENVYSSPVISVILNIFPEHLDHYESFEAYARTKWNVGLYQKWGGRLFIPDDWLKKEWIVYQKQYSGQLTGFGAKDDEIIYKFDETCFEQKLDLDRILLQGSHNLKNIAAALGVAVEAGVCLSDAIVSLYNFKPLPHRLEFIKEVNGVKYINDSISTIPQSSIAAMKAYPKTETIILGGMNRGIDYSALIDYLLKSDVRNVVLMGEVGDIIGKEMEVRQSRISLHYAGDMQQAVEFASLNTTAGGVCLLSPAAASYDKYINFEYRGDDFRKCVESLK